jgi:hypothetical protein
MRGEQILLVPLQTAWPRFLLTGKATAQPPRFDLARTLPALEKARAVALTVGSAEVLDPPEETVPWTETHRWVLMLILMLALAGMFWVVLQQLVRTHRQA